MPAPSADAAFASWIAEVPVLPVRSVATAEALGLVLANPVRAAHDLPPFARSMMDGYAVRLADAGRSLPVAGAVHAGDAPRALPAAAALAVMTGAAVPDGAEAVVQRELCTVADGRVTLPERIRAQANIVPRAGEAAAGAEVLPAGEALSPLALAVAAALGVDALAVVPRPRVAIRCTGSELASGPLAPGAIRDSNGPMLAAMCAELGLACERGTVPDDREAIAAAVRGAEADLLIMTGGVSAGDRDFVPGVLRDLGWRIVVQGVDQKPGKPLLLARRGDRLVAALPGNPLAVHWCFTRFVAPALRRLAGASAEPRRSPGELEAPLPGSKERPWFVPVRTRRDGGRLLVRPLPPVSSADVVAPALADAYVAVAAGAPARHAGEAVEVLWCGAAAWGRG